jgi:hypothetical protein
VQGAEPPPLDLPFPAACAAGNGGEVSRSGSFDHGRRRVVGAAVTEAESGVDEATFVELDDELLDVFLVRAGVLDDGRDEDVVGKSPLRESLVEGRRRSGWCLGSGTSRCRFSVEAGRVLVRTPYVFGTSAVFRAIERNRTPPAGVEDHGRAGAS